MTKRTRAALASQIASLINDNTTGDISPADVRSNFIDLLDSILTQDEAAKCNLVATTDPSVTDDSNSGYSVGSEWFNGTTGRAFRAVNVAVGAAVWVPYQTYLADEWHPNTLLYPDHIEVPTTDPIDGSNLGPFFLPFTVPNYRTLTGIGVHMTVAGAAGSAMRLGLYEDAGGLPGKVVVDAGEITTNATGERWATVNVALKPGRYWSAQLHKAASTGTHYRVMDTRFNSRVKDTVSGLTGVGHRGYLGTSAPTYGANAFSTGMPVAPAVVTSGSNQMSIVMLRAGG